MSIGRVVDRVLGMLTFGRVGRAKQAAGKVGEVWIERLGEADRLQHWQPYGFVTAPLPGSTALVAAMGSHGNSRIVWLVGDRRYTIALEGGEVAIVDDLGQRVHLTRTGVVIEAATIKLGASAVAGIAREGDAIGLNADFSVWASAVHSALALPDSPPSGNGTIIESSAKVKAE